jgi:hypothetical protein
MSAVGAVYDRAYFVDARKSAVIDRAYNSSSGPFIRLCAKPSSAEEKLLVRQTLYRVWAKKCSHHAPHQKTYLKPNWISRGATDVLLMTPKFAVPKFVPGLANWG